MLRAILVIFSLCVFSTVSNAATSRLPFTLQCTYSNWKTHLTAEKPAPTDPQEKMLHEWEQYNNQMAHADLMYRMQMGEQATTGDIFNAVVAGGKLAIDAGTRVLERETIRCRIDGATPAMDIRFFPLYMTRFTDGKHSRFVEKKDVSLKAGSTFSFSVHTVKSNLQYVLVECVKDDRALCRFIGRIRDGKKLLVEDGSSIKEIFVDPNALIKEYPISKF